VNIEILAKTRKVLGGLTDFLKILMGNHPALHTFGSISVFELEGRRPVISIGSSSLFDPSSGGSFFHPI
jgi:hypothetical protein